MKAICIAAHNRPALLRECLVSVKAALRKPWVIFINLNPGCPENLSLVREYNTNFKLNKPSLGACENTFAVCQRAFKSGASAILYLDDDVLLSPDAIQLCDWALDKYPEGAGLALCRKDGNDPSRPSSISLTDTWMGHLGQGHCYSKAVWENFVQRYFWYREPSFQGGADWALCEMAVRTGRIILRPRLARAKHNGAIGYHGPGIGVFPDVISDGTHTDYYLE